MLTVFNFQQTSFDCKCRQVKMPVLGIRVTFRVNAWMWYRLRANKIDAWHSLLSWSKRWRQKKKKRHIQYSTSLLVFEGFQFANRFKQNNHFGNIFVDFLKLYVWCGKKLIDGAKISNIYLPNLLLINLQYLAGPVGIL